MQSDLNTVDKSLPGSKSSFAYPWMPDCSNGTYCNPVLYADYSDPDVIRVGQDFYLVASSFNCTPGLPILHSRDLVNWTLVNHALKNLPDARYEKVQPGCGVWAPSIRFHADKFWIFFPTPDEGIYVITASHPTGKWSEPHLVQPGQGLIDPCPLWDDDGNAYLVHAYAKSRSGIKHMLRVRPMSPDGSRLLGAGEIVFHEPDKHPTLEGPKFLKKDGWYYILAPAGGVETGWQTVLRSKNIYGPYEDKIVLSQGETNINGPHQGALVDTADGTWWFLHFQDDGLYGRIIHLQPVEWQDGWPLMGNMGEPIGHHKKPIAVPGAQPCVPQASDEFDNHKLSLQWQWNANHHDSWFSLADRPGWLRLFPKLPATKTTDQPNLLLQKFPARSFTIETFLEITAQQTGEEAGLIIVGEAYATLSLQYHQTKNRIVLATNGTQCALYESSQNAIALRAEVKDGGLCSFSFSEGSTFIPINHHFQATKGVWIGARVGIYSLKRSESGSSGHVDFDYFRFR